MGLTAPLVRGAVRSQRRDQFGHTLLIFLVLRTVSDDQIALFPADRRQNVGGRQRCKQRVGAVIVGVAQKAINQPTYRGKYPYYKWAPMSYSPKLGGIRVLTFDSFNGS